jgi:hypothetical protein
MITHESNRPPIELDSLLRRALCERVVDAEPSRRVRIDVLRVATIVRVQSPDAGDHAAESATARAWTALWPGWGPHTHTQVRMDIIRAQFDWARFLL